MKISTTKRLISGTAASWMRLLVTLATQIVLVPAYLTYWDSNTYGIWIAIQSLVTVLTIIDQGYQTFLEFEFLRIGNKEPKILSINLWSSLYVAFFIGLMEIIVAVLITKFGLINKLIFNNLVVNKTLQTQANTVFVILVVIWVVTGLFGGILVRSLSPFGYYSRMSWWGVWSAIITAVVPVIALLFDTDIIWVGSSLAMSTIFYNLFFMKEVMGLIKKEEINYNGFVLRTGYRNLLKSLIISGKSLLESSRQQGVRIILAPLIGTSGLVAFTTMRTGANVALQGLNTITNPLMPELMRFLNQKDQERTEACFGSVWFVVLFLLSPSVLLLQAFAEPLFNFWTKGKVTFNPLLFAMLSLGVLVYAVAQPAMAVIRGNNLLRQQLVISIISALIVISGMFIMVPLFGIVGAGLTLIISEIIATFGYRMIAKKWLLSNSMKWPQRSATIALCSVWLTGLTILVMIYLPTAKWIALICGMSLLGLSGYLYWLTAPVIVKHKAIMVASKLPFSTFLLR